MRVHRAFVLGLVEAAVLAALGVASGGCIRCYKYRAPEVAPAFKDSKAPESARPGPPPVDEHTYAGDEFDYHLKLPAGWTFKDADEAVSDALGRSWTRKRLEGVESGGTPDTRASLTVVVRDEFLDGEDLVRRDLDAWLRALAAAHAGIGTPAARSMPPDAPAGVVFAITAVDALGKRWAYDRAYLFAVATARSYVLTFRMPAERRKGFSGQIDAVLQGLTLLDPPEGVPSDASGCMTHVGGLAAKGRLARAAHCWALLLDAGVGDASPMRYALGDTLERMGLAEEALAQYRRAAEETKRLGEIATARLAEGLLLRRAGRTEEAMAAYEKGLAASPDDRRLLLNFGLALHLAADPGRAAAVYERILGGAPDDVDVIENLASALADAGRVAEAKTRLERAIALRRAQVAAGGAGADDAERWLARDEEALRKVKERLKR